MRTIEEDIISWSKDFLELPNKELGDKPVCPYAKQARISGQVNIVVEESGEKFSDYADYFWKNVQPGIWTQLTN